MAVFQEYDDRHDALEQRKPMNLVQGPLQVAVIAPTTDIRQYPETGGRVRVEELPAGPVQEPLPEPVEAAPPQARQPQSGQSPRGTSSPFTIAETPAEASAWRWDFSVARIEENAQIEIKLNYLNDQIKKIKTEMAIMRRDERTFRAVALPEKYASGVLGEYITVFAGFVDVELTDTGRALIEQFVNDLTAENEYIQRTAQAQGEPPQLTELQIDTPLVSHQILQKYEKFLARWEAAKATWSNSLPAIVGNWHEFVNDERFAEIVAQFKLPHSITELIRRV
jgi:hypothetical protein